MHARLSIPLRDGREPDKASYHKVYRDIQRAIHKKQRQPILLERDQERAAQFDSRTRNALESLKQSLVPEPTLRLAPRLSCLPGKKVEARDCSQTSIKPRQKTSRPDTRQPGRVTNNTSAISSSRRNSVISSNRGPTPQNKSVQHLNKSIGVIGKENIPPVHSQNVIRPHLPVNTDNYRSVPVKKPSELNESRSEVTIIPKAMALKKDGSVLFIRKKVYHRTQIPVAEATKNYSSVPTPEPRERARSSLAIRPQQKLVAEVHNISSVLRERADDINDLVGDELSSIGNHIHRNANRCRLPVSEA